jgi:hypothetical protein
VITDELLDIVGGFETLSDWRWGHSTVSFND